MKDLLFELTAIVLAFLCWSVMFGIPMTAAIVVWNLTSSKILAAVTFVATVIAITKIAEALGIDLGEIVIDEEQW